MKILYLENHAIFAEQVTKQFLSAHDVTVVTSLVDARDALTRSHFDLILSDYDLDDGKGDVFVREFRAAHPELPIIAASSHDEGNAALVRTGASAICGMEFHRIQLVIAGLKLRYAALPGLLHLFTLCEQLSKAPFPTIDSHIFTSE